MPEHIFSDLQLPIDVIPQNIAVYRYVDGDFIFIDFNEMAEKTEKISKQEVLAKKLTEVFPGVKEFGLFNVLLRVHNNGGYEEFDMKLYKDHRISGWRKNRVFKLPNGDVIAIYSDLTNLKHYEHELNQHKRQLDTSERRFRHLVESTDDWIWEVDAQNIYTYVSHQVKSTLGYLPDEVLGKTPFDFMDPDEAEKISLIYKQLILNREKIVNLVNINRHKDGQKIYLQTNATPYFDKTGILLGYRGIDKDITQMHYATKHLEDQKFFLQSIIDGISDPVMVIRRDFEILLMNASVRKKLEQRFISNIEHIKCYEILHNRSTPCDGVYTHCPMSVVISTKKPVTVVHFDPDKHDNKKYFELTTSPLLDKDKNHMGVIEVVRDVTSHLKTQNKLRKQKNILDYKAHYDHLTGLPNRDLFLDRLSQAIKAAQRSACLIAILFIDLDHFKKINDSLGHHVGDEVLKEASRRLQKQIRETDTVARLGGDEFTVILDALHDTNVLIDIVQNMIDAMNKPIQIDEHLLYSTISIGITIFPDDGSISDILLKNADTAMYKAKDEGRNTYRFYTEEMTEKAFERIVMETNFRQALDNEYFIVYYQPQINGESGELIGMEALIRWKHETMGMVSPAKFISLAVETGLIVPLDQWTMRTTMKQMVKWYAEGLNPGVLALNLAMKQLHQKEFIDLLATMLKETGCKPEWLELEVTEGQIMTNPDNAIAMLDQISGMGIDLAIDDFGTGYSSLSYLKRLPIDKLKIDRSFVKNLPDDMDDAAIVRSIIALSQNLNLKVIAEGVETEAQKAFLVAHGCPNIQGYLYAKPMTVDEMEMYLQKSGI